MKTKTRRIINRYNEELHNIDRQSKAIYNAAIVRWDNFRSELENIQKPVGPVKREQ
jgi:hypothetical protein